MVKDGIVLDTSFSKDDRNEAQGRRLCDRMRPTVTFGEVHRFDPEVTVDEGRGRADSGRKGEFPLGIRSPSPDRRGELLEVTEGVS